VEGWGRFRVLRPVPPAWGYRLCEETGLGSGTVYPILDRLERAGYVRSYRETPTPPGRPPRRFYELTGTGRELAVQAARLRMPRWRAAESGGLA
jgi:PadR family transcriptional regulator, regulatory protein PadR